MGNIMFSHLYCYAWLRSRDAGIIYGYFLVMFLELN